MRATAWSNGSPADSGAGFGLRIGKADRDRYCQRAWGGLVVALPGDEEVIVPLSRSFWRSCTELRSASIGRWMLKNRLAPWPKGAPPVFDLEPTGDNHFALRTSAH